MFTLAAYAAIFIVTAIVGYMAAPKPPKAQPPAIINEGDFPQTEDGAAQYVVFGDVWINDWIVLAFGNQRTSKVVTKGGK